MKTDGANPEVLLVPRVLYVYNFFHMLMHGIGPLLYNNTVEKGKEHRRKHWNQSIIHCVTVNMI